ncbi:DMT family transporter [Deinococcus sp. KNUC1210]|uniref:DMT family transporter n=1 Tax=Deinococcus sp. KNUC1210 TaxID=2917691 RepID=UPI001EF0C69F|nr:EamA family transporter [Deinococcus sp. KNUC1210]ULH14792.1 DMT family transporter [Deinococcus sp. KNUC1210]
MNLTALFGLLSALTYGVGDFAAGMASRRDSPARVTALTHPLACLFFVLLALFRHEQTPQLADLAWGAGAGLLGLGAVLLFYRALVLGPMGLVSVVSAALSALIPVAVGAALGETLTPHNLLGVALTIGGIVLLSLAPSHGGRGGVLPALLAGLGFGLFFVMLAQTSPGSVFWPLAAARFASSAVMVPLTALREGLRPNRPWLLAAATPGDALGNLFYLLAAQAGRMGIAGLLTGLYPVFTTLLAALFLHERLRRLQWAGVALALAGVPLVTG